MKRYDGFFKINIVHEDTVAGLRAAGVLQHLAARLGARLERDINPWQICTRVWKFEWLQNPELWEEAVARAVESDLIILAMGGRAELPACVRCWIESVLPRKREGLTGLIALLDRRWETRPLPPARYLRQLARQYGVNFFCNFDNRPAPVESGIELVLSQREKDSVFSGAAFRHSLRMQNPEVWQPPPVWTNRREASTRADLCSALQP